MTSKKFTFLEIFELIFIYADVSILQNSGYPYHCLPRF